MRRVGMALLAAAVTAVPADAQDTAAYFGAVAEYFSLPSNEISILGDWHLPPDEIPVVLFVAQRAGVSPEALVALRRSGTAWSALAARYQVGPGAFHVPLSADAAAGRLADAFRQYRSLPPAQWGEVSLTDADIVALVNVRVLSESVGLALGEVLSQAGASGSFVDLYNRLVG